MHSSTHSSGTAIPDSEIDQFLFYYGGLGGRNNSGLSNWVSDMLILACAILKIILMIFNF